MIAQSIGIYVAVGLVFFGIGDLMMATPAGRQDRISLPDAYRRRIAHWRAACRKDGLSVTVPAIGFIVLAWAPLLIALLLGEWALRRQGTKIEEQEPARFTALRGAALTDVTLAEIETAEMVFDPAGAAPALPFGFGNADWEALKAQALPGDQWKRFREEVVRPVWLKYGEKDDGYRKADVSEGYTLFRGHEIVGEITAQKGTFVRVIDGRKARRASRHQESRLKHLCSGRR